METFKNFIVGFFVAVLALIIMAFVIFLWPVMVGLGSLVLSITVAIAAVILLFYLIVFIGYVVRKGLERSDRNSR